MSRSCRLGLATLLTAVACGDAPAPVRTVTGHAWATHLTADGVRTAPDAHALTSLEAGVFTEEGGYTRLTAARTGGADFEVRQVPEGALLYVRFRATPSQDALAGPPLHYVVTREPTVDLDVHGLLGRPDAPTCLAPVPARLDAGTLAEGHGALLVSPDVGALAAYDTRGTLGSLNGDARCAEGGRDRSWLLERRAEPLPHPRSGWLTRVTRTAGPLDLALAGATAPVDLTATLTAPGTQALEVDFGALRASALAAGVEPGFRVGENGETLAEAWGVQVRALLRDPTSGATAVLSPALLEHAQASTGEPSYAVPLPELGRPWEPLVSVSTVGMSRRTRGAAATAWALTPPRNVRLSGSQDAAERAAPTLSWDAPALGEPTWYAVHVARIESSQLETSTPVATLYTRERTLRLPPEVVPVLSSSGGVERSYSVSVEALLAHGAEGAGPPARSVEAWPERSSSSARAE